MSQRPIGANADRRRRLTLWLTGSLVLIAALLAGSAPLSSAAAAPRPSPGAHARPHITTVTLVTGDVVHVITQPNGRRSVSLERSPDGSYPQAAITDTGTHLYVVPRSATPLLASRRLDLDLFDVAGLIKQHYDDAHRATLPVIVSYGQGLQAGGDARASSFISAQKTAALPLLGVSAFAVDKRRASSFWSSLTAGGGTGAPTALAGGATRVDLDGTVHTLVDPDVEQIHAPEAWAAGYDGTGTEVAVLDTGYDPTHPDLEGQVSDTANFSSESSVVDGNGHGTHPTSTGAAHRGGVHPEIRRRRRRPGLANRLHAGRHRYGDNAGITILPHVRDFSITGPFKVTGVSDTPSRRKVFICRPTSQVDGIPCARKILSSLAGEAYRRTANSEDVESLMTFYGDARKGHDFEAGIKAALQALLASPKFVFRFESTPALAKAGQTYRLSDS